jgi:pimeloyl-ACP methyl ester carboxylesterase
LIEKLKIAPVDVVGVSFGGFTALELAVKHPEMVRKLVVVEPAILSWLPGIPGGQALLDDLLRANIGEWEAMTTPPSCHPERERWTRVWEGRPSSRQGPSLPLGMS